ncbi:DUF3040 domain-containing protein [Amycolatopsis albispora]|uniref:DUF3040 domain-containing protein n=1 Tax=Amycolatopsis albispora TaxID=1804986 RepID=A0A344L2Y1_9PSEU|nr:DUF3040 domain-containing protein [Amycolatopsis albispora]AXB42405.1 hypothetical protein A4R43_07585 [Amycolatopsis albispora]
MSEPDPQVLRQIENGLRADDPRLAAQLGTSPEVRAQQWRVILVLADITVVLMVTVGAAGGGAALLLWGLLAAGCLGYVHWLKRDERPFADDQRSRWGSS